MIYGQGAIRCHKYVFPEMEAARENDLRKFDRLVFGHVGFAINRAVRSFTLALPGSMLPRAPIDGEFAPYFRKLARMPSPLAFRSELTMGVVVGNVKFRELLSARLGDYLSSDMANSVSE